MATTKMNPGDSPMTKAQLLELHPLPSELAKAKLIERLWIFELPGTPAALWPFISDTSRMNRALGTSEMTFTEKAGKRYGSSKAGGVRHEWFEVPWNWVAEQWLTSTRIYERGFMKVMYSIHRLEATSTRTRVYVYFATVPRGAFGATCIPIGFPTLQRPDRRGLPAIAAQLDNVSAEAHCEVCVVDFSTDKVEAIEVTFRVHPSIRDVPERLYCSAEPATKDHVRVQTTVGPGESVTLRPRLAPGRYCVFIDHEGGWYLDIDDAGETEVAWKEALPDGTALRVAPEPKVTF